MLESTKSAFSTLSKGNQACRAYVFIWKIFPSLVCAHISMQQETTSVKMAIGIKDLNEL